MSRFVGAAHKPQGLENQLIVALGSPGQLRKYVERVHLTDRQVLLAPGEPQQFVYFPAGCLVSILTEARDAPGIEVGAVGAEGFTGLPIFLGTNWGAPRRAICQIEGEALRMSAEAFRQLLQRTPAMAPALCRYTGVRLFEATELLACSAMHPVKRRLARWLLMAADRVCANQFRLTRTFWRACWARVGRISMACCESFSAVAASRTTAVTCRCWTGSASRLRPAITIASFGTSTDVSCHPFIRLTSPYMQ